ncbi:hypothetical protein C8J57DRAFT_1230520 [Mycena rebaudengoi]|nr:hypothetical protein C8J57DRAFT_1230520 [Mycena rebaudengoi]
MSLGREEDVHESGLALFKRRPTLELRQSSAAAPLHPAGEAAAQKREDILLALRFALSLCDTISGVVSGAEARCRAGVWRWCNFTFMWWCALRGPPAATVLLLRHARSAGHNFTASRRRSVVLSLSRAVRVGGSGWSGRLVVERVDVR